MSRFPRHRSRRGLALVAAALALPAAPRPVAAQVPDAGRVLESVPPPPAAPLQTPPLEQRLPPEGAAPAAPGEGGPAVEVRAFRYEGNDSLPAEALDRVLQPWSGRRLDFAQLQQAADALRDHYRDAGFFLARVLLPPQPLAQGVVTLRIVEGTIGRVQAQLAPEARVPAALVQAYLARLAPGTALTEQAVEQPLLLLNDLPGVRLHSLLRRGEGAGQADLDVEVSAEPQPLHGSVALDNFGNRNLGRTRLAAELEGRSLLRQGELLTLSLLQGGAGLRYGRLGAVLPAGAAGTKLLLAYTVLRYRVGGAFEALDADGSARVASLGLQHPLLRTRNASVFAVAGLERKDVDDRQQDGAVTNARRLDAARLALLGEWRDDALGGGLNSYALNLTLGRNALRTPEALQADLSEAGHATRGRYSRLQLDWLRLQRLPEGGLLGRQPSLLLSLRAQLANANLDPAEKGSLGGPRGVRAYPQGAGAGDELAQLTVELRRPLGAVRGAAVVASAFVDAGTVRAVHRPRSGDEDNRIALAAWGLGLNVVRRDDLQLRLDVAARLGRDRWHGDDSRGARGWLLLQKWF